MQAGVGLLVLDVMHIYMIIPRYSHNYAQLCQLLNSNSFTHRKILMLLREATSETYGPGSIFSAFYFTLHLYHKKYQKYYLIISIRCHSRV